jgi:hypothetical protein
VLMAIIVLLTLTAWVTVVQRVMFVYAETTGRHSAGRDAEEASGFAAPASHPLGKGE